MPEGQGEPWTCKQCQNQNWPLRTTCNNKKCGAPGPWTCPACGNKNLEKRMVCNRKSCCLPRPANMGGQQQPQQYWPQPMPMMGGKGGPMGGKGGPMMYSSPFPMGGGKGNGGGHPDGSWTCKECQNVNFPLRTVCNNKKCGALGPWACPTCGNKNFQGRAVCNKKDCGLARPEKVTSGNAPHPPVMQYAAQPMYYPPQPQMYGGFQQKGQQNGGKASGGKGGGNPPGSWTCPSCENVNWPLRTTCNKKECGQPKPF